MLLCRIEGGARRLRDALMEVAVDTNSVLLIGTATVDVLVSGVIVNT